MIHKHADRYYEVLGAPKPGRPFNAVDIYRFRFVAQHLVNGSVLDVGAYFSDFMKIARNKNHIVYGTEINQTRVALANELFGEKVVRMDFRNGLLTKFKNKSIDNVVCMEVLEHIADDKKALKELCRVAAKRVIITVPFMETIKEVVCVHCNKYTPYSGHLHTYENGSFNKIIPEGWKIIKQESFAKPFIRSLLKKLPKSNVVPYQLTRMLDHVSQRKGNWLLVVLEKS